MSLRTENKAFSRLPRHPQRFSFVLLPEFSMIALSAALEPLRHANRTSGQTLYEWRIYSDDGGPLSSSSGLRLSVDGELDAVDLRSIIVVCGGTNVIRNSSPRMAVWLRKAARFSTMIGGLCTGPFSLAAAGLLDGHRATIHWECFDAFREAFPKVNVSRSLFELDGNRFTCAGETASIDMMVAFLSGWHGDKLANRVAEQVVQTRIRAAKDEQRLSFPVRFGTRNPKLREAIELMGEHIEDPISIDALAIATGSSRRQLERLFRRYAECSPMTYYRGIRLERARAFLLETHLTPAQAALACGFSSVTALSKAYRSRFGHSPHNEHGIPQFEDSQRVRMSTRDRIHQERIRQKSAIDNIVRASDAGRRGRE